MTSPILLAALGLTLASVSFAQDANEEALILNQELEFLEESVGQPAQVMAAENTKRSKRSAPGENPSLERIYFGDETDTVSERTAAPKRKVRSL